MKCRNCGKEILGNANFCRYCGAKVLYDEKVTVASALDQPAPLPIADTLLAEKPEKHSRLSVKNIIALIAASSLVAVLFLIIFVSRGSQTTDADESAKVSLSAQLEQAQTWQECCEIGQIYLKEQDYESAIAAFETALTLEDADDSVRLALAEAYFAAERYENALDEYEILAQSGMKPYYEERTQCYISLNQPEKAGQMLREAYLQTGDEAIAALEQKYWNTDAMHAYDEYIGYDGNYAFGLFDWNHDLTPELMYVYNTSDYGNTAGASVEL